MSYTTHFVVLFWSFLVDLCVVGVFISLLYLCVPEKKRSKKFDPLAFYQLPRHRVSKDFFLGRIEYSV